MRNVNVGILGCGVISNTYIRDIKRFYPSLHLAVCADVKVELPELYPHIGEYTRGIGVLDLADSIVSGRKPRVNAEMACHVIEAITGMMESARDKKVYEMKTACERPEPVRTGTPVGRI